MSHPTFIGPVNIGSEEMVTINQLVDITSRIAGKEISKNHVPGPTGVMGRNSNNDLIRQQIGWDNQTSLEKGIRQTYEWILAQTLQIG
jgi:nucleoside-diphosphate-sugar epimerase